MFNVYPRMTKIRIGGNGNGNQAAFDLDFDQDTSTPAAIEDYLEKCGWTKVGSHPDTMEDLWQCKENYAQYGYYKWEQAIAVEMFVFMNLGPR